MSFFSLANQSTKKKVEEQNPSKKLALTPKNSLILYYCEFLGLWIKNVLTLL